MPCHLISDVRMLLPMNAVTFHCGRAVTAMAIIHPVTAQVKLMSCMPVFTIPPSSLLPATGHSLDPIFAAGVPAARDDGPSPFSPSSLWCCLTSFPPLLSSHSLWSFQLLKGNKNKGLLSSPNSVSNCFTTGFSLNWVFFLFLCLDFLYQLFSL